MSTQQQQPQQPLLVHCPSSSPVIIIPPPPPPPPPVFSAPILSSASSPPPPPSPLITFLHAPKAKKRKCTKSKKKPETVATAAGDDEAAGKHKKRGRRKKPEDKRVQSSALMATAKNLCASRVYVVFASNDYNQLHGLDMTLSALGAFEYTKAASSFVTAQALPLSSPYSVATETLSIPTRLTEGAIRWLCLAGTAMATTISDEDRQADDKRNMLIAGGVPCGCTVRLTNGCKQLNVTCWTQPRYSLTDDIVDTLLALVAGVYLCANPETLTFLVMAFVLHYACNYTADGIEALNREINSDPLIQKSIASICGDDGINANADVAAAAPPTPPILIGLLADCLRCIVQKDFLASARLLKSGVELDCIVSLYPECNVMNLPGEASLHLPRALVLLRETFERNFTSQELPHDNDVAFMGNCVYHALNRHVSLTPDDILINMTAPPSNFVAYAPPAEDSGAPMFSRFRNCCWHTMNKKKNTPTIYICAPELGNTMGQDEQRCPFPYTYTHRRKCGHGLDCVRIPLDKSQRCAYFPTSNSLYASLNALNLIYDKDSGAEATIVDQNRWKEAPWLESYIVPCSNAEALLNSDSNMDEPVASSPIAAVRSHAFESVLIRAINFFGRTRVYY